LAPLFGASFIALPATGDQLPLGLLLPSPPHEPPTTVRAADETAKPEVLRQQQQIFEQRYDLSDRPIPA
jgi:cytochrome c peroxidase